MLHALFMGFDLLMSPNLDEMQDTSSGSTHREFTGQTLK